MRFLELCPMHYPDALLGLCPMHFPDELPGTLSDALP